jgi:DNA-binding transcriptional LysR family regulator
MRWSDPVQLGSIEIFLKAAETLSFSQAANALGLGAPAVSRSIARLEERLGVSLFVRTTRKVRLTDDGQLYFEQCRQALQQINDVEETIRGQRRVPQGRLRVSVPTTYGHYRIIPLLAAFAKLYPGIIIELNVSNRNIDFVEEGYDVAIRLGDLSDNRLVARKLETAKLGVYASQDYLTQNPAPKSPMELVHHKLITFERPSTGRAMPWLFSDQGQDIEHAPKAQVGFSDDVLACVRYARHGGGLVQTYDFIVAEDVAAGKLVEVLKNFRGRSRSFSILYPQNRHMSPRVRAFVDYMVQNIPAAKPPRG